MSNWTELTDQVFAVLGLYRINPNLFGIPFSHEKGVKNTKIDCCVWVLKRLS